MNETGSSVSLSLLKRLRDPKVMAIVIGIGIGFYPVLSTAITMADLPDFIGCWLAPAMFFVGCILFILVVCGAIYALVFGIFSSTRKSAAFIAIASMLAIATIIPGSIVAYRLRMFEFRLLSERAKPLIAAIHRYEKETGHPLEKLEDLVPRYFSSVPKTGIYKYPDYEYKQLKDEDDPWELVISCGVGPLNWDEFYYRPSEKYGERVGGEVEPMGTWAYFHE